MEFYRWAALGSFLVPLLMHKWKADLRIRPASLLLFFHLMAGYGGYLVWTNDKWLRLMIEVFVLMQISGILGVTAGAHRLWSHMSFRANIKTRIVMMIANSIANQGCVYNWVRIHRCHHKNSDTEKDPHNITRGFWYAHFGWLILRVPNVVKSEYQKINLDDLKEDWVVMFQYMLDPYWNQFWCFIVPAIYGYYVYDDFWLGLVVLGILRYVLSLNTTWMINSVAHTFGDRPYNPKMKPTDASKYTIILNFLTGGELLGHQWHHIHPKDYKASQKSNWSTHFNPTKYLIDLLAFFGQVTDRISI